MIGILLEVSFNFIFSKWGLWIGVFCCINYYFIYKWSTSTYNKFAKCSIKFIPPRPFFGNYKDFFLMKKTYYEITQDIYNYFPTEKIYGIFELRKPKVLIRDPMILRQLTIKDSDHFVDRITSISEDQDPLISLNLALISGKKWKNIRSSVSPAFTSSKMKMMFQLLCECCEDTIDFLVDKTKGDKTLLMNTKDLFSRIGNDVIATCAFGFKVDSFRDRNNDFYRHGQELTDLSGIHGLKFFFLLRFPKLFKFLGLSIFSKTFSDFFRNIIWKTIKQREENNIFRPDIINIMMEARKGKPSSNDSHQQKEEGYATVEEFPIENTNDNKKLTDDDVMAQCLTFFMAGFATTGNALCLMAHELAINPDIQKTLLAEVDATSEFLNGKPLSYEAMHSMKYLDMVVSETLRHWPAIPTSGRTCTKPYTIEVDGGVSHSFEVGDIFFIPIVALHHDPKYFPNPSKFDPERFSEENKHKIVPFSYLPFGAGPRNCIGSRFALMELKAIMYYILTKFTFEVSEKTQIPIKLAKLQYFVKPEKGFWLNLQPRN